MKLTPHLWNLLGLESIDVSVYVGGAIQHAYSATDSAARKHLCLQANRRVDAGFNACYEQTIKFSLIRPNP